MKTGDLVRAVHPTLGVQYGTVIQMVRVEGTMPLPGSIWQGDDSIRCSWFGRIQPAHVFARVRWQDQSYPPVLPPTVITTHLRTVSPLEALADQAT